MSHSTVYCPFQLFLAPISLLMISATSVGRAMREVPAILRQRAFGQEERGHEPVSMAAPVFSSSSVSLPNLTFSSSTSQYPFLRTGT